MADRVGTRTQDTDETSGEDDPSGSDVASPAGAVPEPRPPRPWTLAVDIGGTGLKASVLDARGAMVADRVKTATTYPMPPDKLVTVLTSLVAPLPGFDRASVGFPGMVRAGRVLSAPHFSTTSGPGSETDPELRERWSSFDLAAALTEAFGVPTKVANDADIQGAAVVSGHGLELVITLGTGFGTGRFYDGPLMPHLELAHQVFHKGQTYNEQLGEEVRKEIGDGRWNKRVLKAIANMRAIFFFDHLYVGGGNSRRLVRDRLDDDVTIVDNSAGILGGIKLWESDHVGVNDVG